MFAANPIYDTPILGMTTRPRVAAAVEYGNATSFWVEYPSGLIDLSRLAHLDKGPLKVVQDENVADMQVRQMQPSTQLDVQVDGDRVVRIAKNRSAIIIIDMQNFFLHPELRNHPTGLACIDPLLKIVPSLRSQGVKILWVNWGLTDHELTTIPPSLVRGFMKNGRGGFGTPLPGNFGRLLMRDEYNSALYGPLQPLYEEGKKAGTDVWIHKNRISGLWGYQTTLDLYLQENGITTLFFAGVNADQCVLGTLVDAYFRGYDCITVKDATATTSPFGGLENMLYNSGNSYGFVTDAERILKATET
ncbi:hypothetical protein AcW1_005688 [Taiwanofungus camphoratus]|nr:hypothetical protein AcW2_004451 [Antrodia cinnamomea]KAI0933091.1 hypothetical protein AcV7_004669 [Antrodia cinnamomea]KAI0934040.1 hypothetical protein AcV5_006015 [Antrodia cinnamomea]KAI0957230.1 hypothetical protein AcW1_005688 [Antrodia cinnamomea]